MLDLRDVVVYGVKVPGHEGRAGMAAIYDPKHILSEDDLNTRLLKRLHNNLPLYAWPVFIRIVDTVRLTESLKFIKCDLKNDAFELRKVGRDPVFVLVNGSRIDRAHYVRLAPPLYEKIMSGRVQL